MLNNIAEAVEAALSGNNEGFTYLYNTTYKNKYYTALKYMKNENDAADVLQDAYMKAFQNLSMLQDHSKFEG
ncbi:MAG TPA: RNA polymerase subunit sigma-70, partial [Lachnospiraceae bacterium]|nr:RNA polymerase subunit sigma-70 [Lachnospiraceae bacterium]